MDPLFTKIYVVFETMTITTLFYMVPEHPSNYNLRGFV